MLQASGGSGEFCRLLLTALSCLFPGPSSAPSTSATFPIPSSPFLPTIWKPEYKLEF